MFAYQRKRDLTLDLNFTKTLVKKNGGKKYNTSGKINCCSIKNDSKTDQAKNNNKNTLKVSII